MPRKSTKAPKEGLHALNLSKSYNHHQILRDVSISLKRGQVVGLLGPNGAGKTTCFSIIAGLVTASQGSIYLDGQDITQMPMYQRARLGIGYLPQEASIFRGLTVEQNITSILELVVTDTDQRQDMLTELLNEFNITHLRRAAAITLSGGERRRVEIARALACDPHFLLLDEPLAGIDPIAMQEIRHLILYLKERGIGVLLTEHNVREALEVIDNGYILTEGKILMAGSPAEIIADKNVRRVYLGESFSL